MTCRCCRHTEAIENVGQCCHAFGRRSLGDMPMDGSSIPVSKRIAITEAVFSPPVRGDSPPQVGILRLLEKSERLRVEPSLTKIFGWIVVSTYPVSVHLLLKPLYPDGRWQIPEKAFGGARAPSRKAVQLVQRRGAYWREKDCYQVSLGGTRILL
jgi:hypothetical protein